MTKEDVVLDRALRPTRLDEYVGQEELKKRLQFSIEGSLKRNEPVGHILLCGGPGLGKTSIASLIAKERGVGFIPVMAQTITSVAQAITILKAIEPYSVLFIDELHGLKQTVEEAFYPAMEDFNIPMKNGDAINANIKIKVNKFTLIGATTMSGQISEPMRDRFDIIHNMQFYSVEELSILIMANAKKLNLNLGEDICKNIANRSRGIPRIANRLLKRILDYVLAKNIQKITISSVEDLFQIERISENGLTDQDMRYLKVIYEYGGKPIGLTGIASSLQETKETVMYDIEPFLIRSGLIRLTKSGRELTGNGYRMIGI